jgi:hypothetical protein
MKRPVNRPRNLQLGRGRDSSGKTPSVVISQPEAHSEEERWQEDMAILRWAAQDLANKRASSREVSQSLVRKRPVEQIAQAVEAPTHIDQKVIRVLYDLNPERAASLFNLAVRDGSPDERRTIGNALANSGLLDEAINKLFDRKRENSYGELSLLFLAAKAGEVAPLTKLIERHPSTELKFAIIQLLASSGGPEVLPAFLRLAGKSSLTANLRVTLQEAIAEITSQQRQEASSAA